MTKSLELELMKLGLKTLLNKFQNQTIVKRQKKGKKWSKEQYKKFAKSMAKTWEKKRDKSV